MLWRMLVVHRHLYRGIARTFAEDFGVLVNPTTALTAEERRAFDWRESDAPETEQYAIEAPFQAAIAYPTDALAPS